MTSFLCLEGSASFSSLQECREEIIEDKICLVFRFRHGSIFMKSLPGETERAAVSNIGNYSEVL